MKKYFMIAMVLMVSLLPMDVFAATGNIEIQLSEHQKGKISYSKVGNMVDGLFVLEDEFEESQVNLNDLKTAEQLEKAAKSLIPYVQSGIVVSIEEDKVLLCNLEEGVYLIYSFGENEKEMLPTLIFLPTWMEEEQKMQYDVTVIPKYGEKQNSPDTGWDSRESIYLGLFAISLIIIVGLSCHNRFKCGTIPFKHLEMGGYTNGNDNDTENPRCPRRLGFSGCRSIN
ncbi:MAG: hypothetical protein IJ439_04440 [Tyzzerella sp.]|nr:hypothetical protein [Tyzzerella sp.]